VRATISDMGPLLLARMLDLNETQAGVLHLVFKIADDSGLLLLDLKDLRAMLQPRGRERQGLHHQVRQRQRRQRRRHPARPAATGTARAPTSSSASPCSNIADLMQTERTARAWSTSWPADKLLTSPRLYATFLLWLLSELFEHLPEVGDPDKPKMVFFFDEAHLLFDDAPKALLERIELVVRLVRSKGVGVYFVTQNPARRARHRAGQLGNRVQHALRAFTPRDQKAVKATAETMRANPGSTSRAPSPNWAVGEALVSFLDAKAAPA
jgi:DNA helicase HerA-like ATPase